MKMLKQVSIFLLAIILTCFLSFLFLNRIITFSISCLTDLDIKYDKCKGSVFREAKVSGLHVGAKNTKLDLTAENALLAIRPWQSEKRRFSLVESTGLKRLFSDC